MCHSSIFQPFSLLKVVVLVCNRDELKSVQTCTKFSSCQILSISTDAEAVKNTPRFPFCLQAFAGNQTQRQNINRPLANVNKNVFTTSTVKCDQPQISTLIIKPISCLAKPHYTSIETRVFGKHLSVKTPANFPKK